jgi:uncharacterized protein (TIGR03437 family)
VEADPGKYQIPPGNPFFQFSSARNEIWALGLRNQWRFSFDRATGDLWIGDVGQDLYEEVDFQPATSRGGENYGWNAAEGPHCYTAGCNLQAYTAPVAEYSHSQGCSATGGFVYRGAAYPGLRGIYLYADYCSRRIWGVERQATAWNNRLLLASGFAISTFGEDQAGELYVANAANGTIHRVEGSLAPRVSEGAVVNAASFAAGLTPGSLVTVFAAGVRDEAGVSVSPTIPLALTIDGVSVTVAGIAAPLHSVANVNGQEQVNFQVPFEVAGLSSAPVTVTRNGRASAAVNAAVLAAQPAVYRDAAGNGIAVHILDYSQVTAARPLVPGEQAFLYASGLGRVLNPPATGSAAPAAPGGQTAGLVRVMVAGIEAETPYAGLAPGFVGVYQVNFRVPDNAPSGLADVQVSVEGSTSAAVKAPIR